jgi:16S rRNA (uracil1498-N3)-methyltransferase
MNLILLTPEEAAGSPIELSGERAEHVLTVLKSVVGDRLRVGVLDGAIGTARVARLGPGTMVALDALELAEVPPLPTVDLLLALPRPKVLARLLSPIAQLGVRRLYLSGAWKVERFYFDAHVLDPAELRTHLLEGLAQVKDTRVPQVSVHRSLTYLVRDELSAFLPEGTQRVVCNLGGPQIEQVVDRAAPHVLLAIGPEGGFTGREEALFEEHGFLRASLGERTLRSDVAVISALSRVCAAR